MNERAVFDGVNVVVKDMQAMAAFYERLGLEFAAGGEAWADHHRSSVAEALTDFDLDGSSFAKTWNSGWPDGKTGVILGFKLSTRAAVDDLFAELVASGYPAQQAPYDAFWGARYAVVVDPDGNSVGLMSPQQEEYRSDPPPPAL